MSKAMVLVGDLGSDHEGFPPTPVIAGSPDVLIDGRPAARVGDPLAPHSKPKHSPHPRTIADGSRTVMINGKPAAITGGAISCGGITMGSGSVVVGESHRSERPPNITPELDRSGSLSPGITQFPKPENLARGQNNENSGGLSTSFATASDSAGDTKKASVEPGFHVVRRPMNKADLLTLFYGDASAKPGNFDRLNPGLGDQVMPGEMVVLGDPEGRECTRKEADLMEVAARVNAKVQAMDQEEAQFIVKYYDLLEAITSTSSAGMGAGSVVIGKQIESIKTILKEVERLHQESYRSYGHLNHPDFFERRSALFKKLDFALGTIARKGMSLDDDAKLKRALGLSSKSIVHNWKAAGIGAIPGYSTHYDKLASGARYAKGFGYLSIGLDVAASGVKIRAACMSGRNSECRRVKFTEGGRLSGAAVGGSVGAFAGPFLCGVIGIGSGGLGGIACGIIMAGVGGTAGGSVGGDTGEDVGEVIFEVTNDE
ncbi:type VI secretion system PAAR protein [Marinobacter santoriniensis]|nr:type VI secretion system PAAR protein [Marinobacter santoriniensis]